MSSYTYSQAANKSTRNQVSSNVQMSHTNQNSSTLTKVLIAFIVLSVIGTIIVAVVMMIVAPQASIHGQNHDINTNSKSKCITQDICNIDDRFDPCDNFFDYSCGEQDTENGLDLWGMLTTENFKHLSKYLNRPIWSYGDPEAIKKSKYIYSACMDVEYIQNNHVKHLQHFIRNAGGWADIGIFPDDGWNINSDLANNHYVGSSAFFTSTVEPDGLNSSKPVIKVTI